MNGDAMKNTTQRDEPNKTRSFRAAFPFRDGAAAKETQAEVVAKIAREVLCLDTLETRHSDTLDFSDQAVWQLRAALEAAYSAGLAGGPSKQIRRLA
jgi:hypothetical protein